MSYARGESILLSHSPIYSNKIAWLMLAGCVLAPMVRVFNHHSNNSKKASRARGLQIILPSTLRFTYYSSTWHIHFTTHAPDSLNHFPHIIRHARILSTHSSTHLPPLLSSSLSPAPVLLCFTCTCGEGAGRGFLCCSAITHTTPPPLLHWFALKKVGAGGVISRFRWEIY